MGKGYWIGIVTTLFAVCDILFVLWSGEYPPGADSRPLSRSDCFAIVLIAEVLVQIILLTVLR